MATQASTAELIAALNRTPGKAEIVDGEIVLMSPTGGLPSRAAAAIYRSLWDIERRTKTGRAYTDNVGYLVDLPQRPARRSSGTWTSSAKGWSVSIAPRRPTISAVYRRGEQAEAEPALPGWSFVVDDLFE